MPSRGRVHMAVAAVVLALQLCVITTSAVAVEHSGGARAMASGGAGAGAGVHRIRMRAAAQAAASATKWPTNCANALPTLQQWQALTPASGPLWDKKARGSSNKAVTNVDTILTNSLGVSANIVALELAVEERIWDDQYLRSINPGIAKTASWRKAAFAKLRTCTLQYFTGTINAAFRSNPSGFLTTNTPAIVASATLAGVAGTATAQQLASNSAVGNGAVYNACNHLLAMNGNNGACRKPLKKGDLPLVEYAAPTATSVAQVWADVKERGPAWTGFGLTLAQINALPIRVVPATGYATSAQGGAPATFLPWKADACTYTVIDAAATVAFTSGLSGCAVYVAYDTSGNGRPPLFMHTNANAIAKASTNQKAKDTCAEEILRLHAGYTKHEKITKAEYGAAGFSITAYGARTNNGAGPWEWKLAKVKTAGGTERHDFVAWT